MSSHIQQVKIIIADINVFKDDPEVILPQIAPCYAEKYHKKKILQDKKHEMISGFLLKQYLDVTKDEQLCYNKYEKPSLVSDEKYFNLSHSDDYVVLAIADCEVGVDIEVMQRCHDAIVKKYFSIKQKEEMEKAGDRKAEIFTKIWTEFEAVLKLKGTGFGESWDREKGPMEQYSLFTERLGDYYLSLATEHKVDVEVQHFSHFHM